MSFEEELNLMVDSAKASIEDIRRNGPKLFDNIDTLNGQQALTIHILRDRDFFLNYSDTGSGKTKAAISASYYLQTRHVLVFCPNSVKTTWRNQILDSNFVRPDNVEIDNLCQNYSEEDFTYEIFNYDKFNSSDRGPARIKRLVNSKRYDLLVFDEIHRLKNKNSETYKNMFTLVQMLRNTNPDIKIFGATATPITTSNADLQGIYEMLSGKKADELTMGNLANQLINANKILETSGFGYFPKSEMTVRYNGIEQDTLFSPNVNGKHIFDTDLANIDGSSIEEEVVDSKGNVTKIEELHLSVKFNAYKHLIRKGTVIYTEYTYGDRILRELKDMVEDTLNLSACIYSGDCKETEDGSNSIEEFKGGSKDVLIGTKSMCEGVDGLQLVCNRVILHTIPSVWSVLWQLKGRFDRQGSKFMKEGVDIFVPMVVFRLNDGKKTSFDMRRWNVAMIRKRKDNITKGGHLEEITLAEKRQLIDSVVEKLKDKYEMTEIEREKIEFDCPDIENVEWKQRESLISDFNRMGRNTNSARFHQELTEEPKAWFDYHRARRESMKDWPEIPYEHIATKIKNRNRVVADFGCGDNQLRNCIPNNKVWAFDHVAADETVTACDMAHTPLGDESVDIAVFSLALWGTNYEDYIKEAYRVLNYDGLVYIAEPSKSYDADKRTELLAMLKRNGFTQVGDIEDRGKFFYITVIKK